MISSHLCTNVPVLFMGDTILFFKVCQL
eukprot:UN15019